MKMTLIPIVIGSLGTIHKVWVKGEKDRNQKRSRYHADYIIIRACENTEKSPVVLREIAATLTQMKMLQLRLV